MTSILLTGAGSTLSSGGGVAPPSFTPADLTGLQLWLDASDSSTVLNSISPDTPATDGQTVRRWLDKSGNGLHANQATAANQPLLDADGQNSKGVLTFDGVNDFLTSGTTSSFNFLHDGTTSLVVVVFKVEPSILGNLYRIVGTLNDTINSTVGYLLNYDDRIAASANNRIVIAVGSATAGNPAVSINDNVFATQTFQILENEIDADNATASQRAKNVVNGTSLALANTDSAAVSTGNSLTSLGIGATQTPSLYLNGGIAELIICNDPNTALRSDLRNYLASKWGITLS